MNDVKMGLTPLEARQEETAAGAGVPEAGAVYSRHRLVMTLDQLDALDTAEMIEGHMSAERGDPEPGTNHSLSYCHGWRTRMYDLGEIETPPQHHALARAYVARMRATPPLQEPSPLPVPHK